MSPADSSPVLPSIDSHATLEYRFFLDANPNPVLVYKFPKLSRQEIQAMFTIDDLKQTRYYQDAKQEGRQEGQATLILRQLSRKFGGLSEELRSNIFQISPAQLENLAEAVLDFASVAELDRWLQENK